MNTTIEQRAEEYAKTRHAEIFDVAIRWSKEDYIAGATEGAAIKDAVILELESQNQYNKEWVDVASEKIKELESRIEKLREALKVICKEDAETFGAGYAIAVLANDDKAKEMSK